MTEGALFSHNPNAPSTSPAPPQPGTHRELRPLTAVTSGYSLQNKTHQRLQGVTSNTPIPQTLHKTNDYHFISIHLTRLSRVIVLLLFI